jgi:hypothetical protein
MRHRYDILTVVQGGIKQRIACIFFSAVCSQNRPYDVIVLLSFERNKPTAVTINIFHSPAVMEHVLQICWVAFSRLCLQYCMMLYTAILPILIHSFLLIPSNFIPPQTHTDTHIWSLFKQKIISSTHQNVSEYCWIELGA